MVGSSAAIRCSPLPLVSFGHGSSPSSFSIRRSLSAVSITKSQAMPSPESRSNTSMSGVLDVVRAGVPRVQLDRAGLNQALLAAEIAAVEGHADIVAGCRLAVGGLALQEQMCARTIGSRHRDLLAEEGISSPKKKQESGERSVALVVDGDGERRALDRRRTGDRLDCRLGPAVGHAKGEAAERRVGFERHPDLLEEGI